MARAIKEGDTKKVSEILTSGPLGLLIGPPPSDMVVKLIDDLTPKQAALKAALENECTCPQCGKKLQVMLFDATEEAKLESRNNCLPQVDALMAANWIFELPPIPDPEPWQWRWRRPSKRKGMKGRLFASTGQAYNALMKEKA